MALCRSAAALLLSLRIVGTAALGTLQSFTVFSEPIFLRRGEVHNRYVIPKALPSEIVQKFAGKTMHMKSAQLDIVLVDNQTGEKRPAPLYTTYNHHHALMLGPQKDLMQLYNYTQGQDPLDPHFLPNDTKHGRHAHRGCMMKRRSFEAILTAALPKARRGHIAAFGGASGAEYRGTSTRLPGHYTYDVNSPESFMVLMHFINTNGVPASQKLWECPCTSARKINVTNGTIDGMKPIPFQCSEQLLQEKNTGCSLSTYQGGYRCCEHGVFLTEELPPHDAPVDQIEAKFTFEYYEPDAPEVKMARGTMQPSCCDATASYLFNSSQFANLEYDVPQCSAGTPPELCEHVISSVEHFDVPGNPNETDPNEEFELVHAWGHQHVAGTGLELYRESTGELVCRSHPKYGTGHVAGDEEGFVVGHSWMKRASIRCCWDTSTASKKPRLDGIPPCVWGPPPLSPPPRFKRNDQVRTVARYNATEQHHGVMSLWILVAASLKSEGLNAEVLI